MVALTHMGDPCASEGLNAGQWDRIREILESALGLASDLRAAYLAEACAGDAALLSEVESLIAASERSALLDHAPLASLAPTITLTATAAGRTIGNYKVVDRIGEGGMGTVYQAVDPRLGRTVALKVISRLGGAADEKRRFFREAKAASALNHPNIVTIYEYDSDHEVDFIAMEYIRGATLHALLAGHRLPIQTLLEYAVQASGAVAAAHAAGIIHRDLKTEQHHGHRYRHSESPGLRLGQTGRKRYRRYTGRRHTGYPCVYVAGAGPGRAGRCALRYLLVRHHSL